MRIEMLLRRGSSLAAALAVPLLVAVPNAAAQECQADADCGSGYRCEAATSTICNTCPSFPSDAGFIFPSDGGLGFPVDGGVFLPAVDAASPWDPKDCDAGCTPYTYHYCTRASCTRDADCPADMLCHNEVWQECTGSSCRPGLDCTADGGLTCSERTQSTCTERYNLPCASDTACGAGFDCNKDPYTVCSGGGGVVFDPDGGVTFVDGGSSCTTETPDSGYCNLLDLPCQTSADCPATLSCQPSYSYPPCIGFPRDAGALIVDGAVLPAPSDGGFISYECPPPVATVVCRPERWAPGPGGGTIGGATGGGLTGGGSYDAGAVVVTDAGSSVPGSIGGGFAGGTTAGTSGGLGGGSSSNSDAGAQAPGEDDEHEGGGGHHGQAWRALLRGLFGSGGCSLGAPPAEGNLAWFALLSGLLVLRTRRRD